jgi:hypothetical protein
MHIKAVDRIVISRRDSNLATAFAAYPCGVRSARSESLGIAIAFLAVQRLA